MDQWNYTAKKQGHPDIFIKKFRVFNPRAIQFTSNRSEAQVLTEDGWMRVFDRDRDKEHRIRCVLEHRLVLISYVD